MPRRSADPLALRTTDLFVLAVLGDGAQHGYALAQAIDARSGGRVRIRPGDLYRVLYRMDAAGLIEMAPGGPPSASDARRTYYRITPLGRRTARDQAEMLSGICSAVLKRTPKAVRP